MIGCDAAMFDARLTRRSQMRSLSPVPFRIATSKFRVLASSFGLMIACCRCEELNIEFESSKGNGEINAE